MGLIGDIYANTASGQDVDLLLERLDISATLTPSTPAVPNCCCSKGSVPYWSNPSFLNFDIWALWRSVLSARMSNIKNDGLDQYDRV